MQRDEPEQAKPEPKLLSLVEYKAERDRAKWERMRQGGAELEHIERRAHRFTSHWPGIAVLLYCVALVVLAAWGIRSCVA